MQLRTLRLWTLGTAIVLMGGGVPAHAAPLANSNEVLVNGGFFHTADTDFGNVNLDLSYGRYLGNPAWQLGLLQGLNWTIIDDAEDPWAAVTAPFVNYHFLGFSQEQTVVPFLGAFTGLVWNDDDATGTLGPQAGFKFFLTDHAFVQTKYRYEWFFDELDQTDDAADDGNHVLSLGIGYVWGGV